MICSNCGREVPAGRRFCDQCGAPLAESCPSCGFGNRPGAKFCGECGSPLTASAAVPQPPGGATSTTAESSGRPTQEAVELRLVSVLFADLVGFTPMAEARDPEEVRELLSRYFDTCRELVERYGGTVEKFIGDAVMAVWGAPHAQEDDAERAVRAGLDLTAAVAALGEDVGAPELAARVGILTGTAAVTVGAQSQGMVAGDLVNTASRIQAQSPPGEVLVGEATKRATEAAVAYADAGVHRLKGKSEPLSLFRALRVVAGRGGLLKSERLEAPFVGRERELRLVKEVFHACTEDRRAHLVQVTGIAGIGKSRLAWEFFKYMDGLKTAYFWHRGRCLAYGQGVTYFALAEMVRGRAGILESEERESALTKLESMVEQYVPEEEDRRFVAPRLAHLLGLEERTAPDKQDLFAAWRLFFERLAESGPVVMAFEDMQWADPSLLEFISYLMEWSRSFPLFVMSLVRPDVAAAGLAANTRNATLIHLEPLLPAAMDRLLTGLVPGLAPPIVERIRLRAEGIPLYAVETVRMLLDRGLLVEEGATYRPAGPIETLEVPETLQALIAARLDGMSAEERRLTQDAAVLGKTFSVAALAGLSGVAEAQLQGMLSSLVAKEVLAVQADPRSPERGQYGFLQDLVRTVAYETISKRERRAKHLAVADFLQRSWGAEAEEIVEVVASHYLEAWRLDPDAPDARQIQARARGMLVRAAERAASLAAAEEAETAFRSAAELSESVSERAALIERAGEMAEQRGRSDTAISRYETASSLFEKAGELRAAARAQARMAGLEWIRGRTDEAVERLRRALSGLDRSIADAEMATVVAQLGRMLALADRGDEATPLLELALALSEKLQLPEVYSQALSSKAILLMLDDRLDESGLLLRRAMQVALEHGFTGAAMRASNNLEMVLESQDRFADVVDQTGQDLALARRAGDRFWELTKLLTPLRSLRMLGRWDEAVSAAREAQATEEIGSLEFAASHLLGLVPVHIRRGELAPARALLESLEWAGKSQDWQIVTEQRECLGELLRAEERPAEALRALEEGLSVQKREGLRIEFTNPNVKGLLVQALEATLELGDLEHAGQLLEEIETALPGQVTPWLRAHSARLSARLAAVSGGGDQVEAGYESAAGGFRALGAVFDLAVALAEEAEWLVSRGHPERAQPLRVEARAIFEQLGAKPWLARLGAAEGAQSVPA